MLLVRLLLIDDHPLIFDAMTLVLKRLPDYISSEFVTRLGDGIEKALAQDPPDLVLLDLGLPGYDGVSALKSFRQACPDVRVAIVSATEDRITIDECLNSGAVGFIPKTFGAGQFRMAIQIMLAGEIFDPGVSSKVLAEPDLSSLAERFRLTSRQMDVLRQMAQGKSNSAIGEELGLAINTVKVHVAAVLEKLGAGNRTEAVTIARRAGLPFE